MVSKSLKIRKGSDVNLTVSAIGYDTYHQNITMDADKIINVSLNKSMYKFTINPTPSDATVKLTANGYTQSGNSITVPYGTTVSYKVSKKNYSTQSGNVTISTHITLPLTLEEFYADETVIYENNMPETKSITIKPGWYEVWIVGGGGGAAACGGGGKSNTGDSSPKNAEGGS